MKRYLIYFLSLLLIFSCAIDIPNDNNNNNNDISFSSGDTLDIMTWNLHLFPSNGPASINYMEDAIFALEPDIIAFQEIRSELSLQTLANRLDDYSYVKADGGSDWGLAYLYNNKEVSLLSDPYEIYSSRTYSRPFPRPPFIMEANWNGKKIIIINNHLKASGDGFLDLKDDWDEETRRKEAIDLLDEYIVDNFPNDRVVILGDMNDELTDIPSNNVFNTMLLNRESYQFTDLSIAEGSNLFWSFPSWPSHIDHIAITNELFLEHYKTETILYDTYLNGRWSEYLKNISDHRPVAISLVIRED